MDYKIIHKQKDCISCGMCSVVCSDFFEIDEKTGKVFLKNGIKNKDGNFEREITDKNKKSVQEASDSCLLELIKIEKIG